MDAIPSNIISNLQNRQFTSLGIGTDLDSWFATHRNAVIENWYMYQGLHQLFMMRFEKEDDNVFMQRVRTATVENHIQPVIDLLVSHLYPKKNSIIRFVSKGDDVDKEITDLLKRICWNHNTIGNVDDTKALNTFVTGYCVLQRLLYDVRTGQEFAPNARPQDVIKYGYIHKRPLDSVYCTPLPYKNLDGTTDLTRLGGILYYADYDNFMGTQEVMRLLGRNLVRKSVIEYVDDDVWLRFVKDVDGGKWRPVTVNPGTNWENRNQFKDVNIPFMVYKNTGDPFYIEGNSEVDKMRTLNLEINELGNADKSTIRYHSYPILVGVNGADLPSDFARTKNAFVSFEGRDQKLEYLTWEGTLEESAARQDTLRASISTTTGISMISRGFLKEIGQIRSGPPLKALFTSERAVMSRKFNLFAYLESIDMRNDIRFWRQVSGQNIEVDNTHTFNVSYSDDFLDIDQLLEQEITSISLQSGSNTVEEVLKSVHPDWTDQQINEAIKQVEEYRSKGAKEKNAQNQSPDKKGNQQE